jgi:hypothetical protein
MAFKAATVSITVSGIAKPLSSTSIRVKQLFVQAMPSNAGPVLLGDSTVLYSGVSGGHIVLSAPVSGVPAEPLHLVPDGIGPILDLSAVYINSVSGLPGVNIFYEEF